MSDRMAAEIWIGGKIPADSIADLCAALDAERLAVDYGECPFRPQSGEDLLSACRANDAGVPLLWLCDDQARGGQFDDLEQFLQTHDISYTRRTESGCGYDAEIVEFRSGMLSPVRVVTNVDGLPVVVTTDVRRVLGLLVAASELRQRSSIIDWWGLVDTALTLLVRCLPPVLPPLAALELTGLDSDEAVPVSPSANAVTPLAQLIDLACQNGIDAAALDAAVHDAAAAAAARTNNGGLTQQVEYLLAELGLAATTQLLAASEIPTFPSPDDSA